MVRLELGISPENLATLYSDDFVRRIADDDMAFDPVFHPLAEYLSAFDGDKFLGAYLVIRFCETEYEAHTLLLASARKHCRELGGMLLSWVFSHERVLRLTGLVREDFKTAINHCRKMGFTHEGTKRDAVTVNGVPTAVEIYGITRKDWRK